MSKYRVKFVKSEPHFTESEISEFKRCCSGISIGNHKFWGNSFFSYLKWIDKNFDYCLLLVGDYIHRLNEELLNGKDEIGNLDLALKLGDKFMNEFEGFLKYFPKDKFDIVSSRFIYETEDYKKYRKVFDSIYTSNLIFKESILKTADEYLYKKQKQGIVLKLSYAEAKNVSIQYLLEELTLLTVIMRKNIKVHIYPSQHLEIFKEIISKKFTDLPITLQESIFVDLRIKKG